ncbi:capsular polysaccharide export protein, LipB/KpsS family [Leclercia barmai]|uniref:Capsular polysaccharide biosynthesis protein n=1 Tax=Leclercia barmai TaxID=2785629 RepID=A0ABS7RV29_9ENTR|nr:hypothetical protein [Leclercia sp. EMC7]MBZ0057728.1 capsular polysaccharide biosynthesis protein [Leclercia sp. EMC7]
MNRKFKKLLKNPSLYFKDAIGNYKKRNDAETEGMIFAFHINEWKRPIIKSWFSDRNFTFVPFNFKNNTIKNNWLNKIKNTKNAEIFVWGMNLPEPFSSLNIKKTFIEDGFIRSIGLGASHTPPLSLNFDSKTLYFNAREESDLELLLNTAKFDEHILTRAKKLKEKLISTGISKYNNSSPVDLFKIYGEKNAKRILVIGQVEDDASIEYGSKIKYTNNDLVTLARLENPDAQIFYKPHPDVLNGFRKYQSNPQDVKNICQVITQDLPLSQAFKTIDHVYTISSLAGFEALIRGIHVTTLGCPFYSGWGLTDDRQENPRRQRTLTVDELFAGAYIQYPKYFDPIYRKYITPEEALEVLVRQRELVHHSQAEELKELENIVTTTFCFRINDWKRPIIESWFPDKKFVYVPFNFKDREMTKKWVQKIKNTKKSEMLIWGMKLPEAFRNIEIKKIYVEDGFLRSIGLGAAHTPPISLNFDSKTLYFNAREESDLEVILNTFKFDADLLKRSQEFREKLISSGISKYNNSSPVDISSIYGEKKSKRVLVIGQVEDDASIEYGSTIKYTNNELVTIARLENPNAQIIYKPHPDVLNGFRKYQSNPQDVKNICQIITQDLPLSQAFETIDHVYTISSLAGFEALIRDIRVTTLGCPFYSGWGLTDDRQANSRRQRKLSIDELFAAAYILYPKYFDPIYKKYISPEDALEALIRQRDIIHQSQVESTKYSEKPMTTVFGFHINDWKRPIIESWFPDKKFLYVPFNFKDKETLKIWVKKIKDTRNAEMLIWGMKLPVAFSKLEIKKTYVEDGFLRSVGLGAAHTPPLSLNFDSKTLYFNAREESDLEVLLNYFDFDENMLNRSREFRKKLIHSGISKYNNSSQVDINSVYGQKKSKRILVIGQVEDDASIAYGSAIKYTNNDIVTIARLENPEAQIIYKPHPDVINGFRKHQSNPQDVKNICQVITQDVPLAQALETIDHVYTISSLAGFEALIREIKVTTMGCPFYSGWGLTDDRQPNSRRTRVLNIDEIFAASYIIYPKYMNPLTRKHISPEEALDFLIKMKEFSTCQTTIANNVQLENNVKLDELLLIRDDIQNLQETISLLSKRIDSHLIEHVKKSHVTN